MFEYQNAHAVGNPVEVNTHLTMASVSEDVSTEFPFRDAIEMFTYLLTSQDWI